MKRALLGLLLCSLCFVTLPSCGVPAPPKQQEIISILPEEIRTVAIQNPFTGEDQVHELALQSLEIEKRQTNEKDDMVYCVLDMKDEWYHYTKYINLHFVYYDQGGWLLEDYAPYASHQWELLKSPFHTEEVSSIIATEWYSEEATLKEQDLENGALCFSAQVNEPHVNGAYLGEVIVICQFDGIEWVYEINNENVRFIWDIVGKWEGSGLIDPDRYGPEDGEVVLAIQNFDQDTLSTNGTWDMKILTHVASGEVWNRQKTFDIGDGGQVGISLEDGGKYLYFRENEINDGFTYNDSYCLFTPDLAVANFGEAAFTRYWDIVLERTE